METTLFNFLVGFGINFAVAFVIVRFIYFPVKQDKNYVFTFLTFNTVIFFVLSLLGNSDLSMGVGFGLFAIFSVLRYRTTTVPIREMTYLFAIIALPTMNALLLSSESWLILLAADTIIMTVLFVLEQGWGFHYEASRQLVYDKTKLLKPENEELLLADLQLRTGLPVKRVEIGKINLGKGLADITLYYDEPDTLSDPFDRLTAVLLIDDAKTAVSTD